MLIGLGVVVMYYIGMVVVYINSNFDWDIFIMGVLVLIVVLVLMVVLWLVMIVKICG